jgi:RNA polymerase sigma-70 factor (sigma-E family)
MIRAETQVSERIDGGRLAELYRSHADMAVRLAYLLTGDLTLAEDLTHDAFVRISGRLLHLRHPGALDAYLRRTVVNLANSHFRRKRVERAYLERERTLRAPEHVDPDISSREALRGALLRLPARQRAAIVLRFYQDLSEAQTAEILGCRPGTAKSLVSRGMRALRDELRGE